MSLKNVYSYSRRLLALGHKGNLFYNRNLAANDKYKKICRVLLNLYTTPLNYVSGAWL